MKLLDLFRKPATAGANEKPDEWWDGGDEIVHDVEETALSDAEHLICLRIGKKANSGDFAVPRIPIVAAQVLGLLSQADPEPKEVAKLICKDHQLAVDVISFANSALFAGVMEVSNIPEAVARVGFHRTRNLILASSLRGLIFGKCNAQRAESLWRHSIGCAAVSARIARNLRSHPDDAYLAGMFHDVGKVVCLALLESATKGGAPCRPEFVDHVLDLYHEGVGVAVTAEWTLPGHVIDAIRKHDEKHAARLTKPQAIVALADNVCRRLKIGVRDDGRVIARGATLEALETAPGDLGRVLEGVRGVVSAEFAR